MSNHQFVFRRRQPNELNELNEFNRRLTRDLKSITIVKSSYTICRIKIRMVHDTFIIWNWNGLSKGKRSITLFDTTLAGRDFGIRQHQREVLSFIPFAYSNYLYRVSNYSKILIFYVCSRYDAKPKLWPIRWHHSSVDSPRQIHDIDILSGSPFLHYIDTRAQNIGNWGKTRKKNLLELDIQKKICFKLFYFSGLAKYSHFIKEPRFIGGGRTRRLQYRIQYDRKIVNFGSVELFSDCIPV